MQKTSHAAFAQNLGATSVQADSVAAPLSIGPEQARNRVFLAPLSGISDVPFRRLARRFGAGLVFSEMVASGELARGCCESAVRAMRDGGGTHAVQLAGRDPVWMRRAAERLVESGADLVDINMGCPAKKVVGGLSGSALMREPELAARIVEATVAGAGSVPVTLKMRLGWDEGSINAPEIARRAVDLGVRMITVHGRTRAQFYEGSADWSAIAAVRAAMDVPLVANGDLTGAAQIRPMLAASSADALMVGRGAQGRPWLPGLLADAVSRDELEVIGLADLVEEHYHSMLSHYGTAAGLRHARKHLGWYIDRFADAIGPVSGDERRAVMTATDPADTLRRLRALLGDCSLADVEPDLMRSSLRRAA